MLSKPIIAPLVGAVVALAVGVAGEYGFTLEKQRIEQDQRSRVTSAVGQYRAALEAELNATLYLTNGLVAYVETHSSLEPAAVRAMLKTLYEQGRHIRNIGVAPGNRLIYIYPEKGNEKAIGLYYPDLPDQWPAVQRAILDHRPMLAGPVQLRQGGVGFIYRVPVFAGPPGRYWGLLSMVLDEESLFSRVGLAPQVDQLQFALRGRDGAGSGGETFMGDAGLFATDAITATISTPGGEWQIAARPARGWTTGARISWLRSGAWAIGLLLGIAVYYALASVAQRLRAERAMESSRDELNEAQRIAMVGSWVLDLRSNRLTWSDEIFRIFEMDSSKFEASYEAFLNAIHPEDRGRVHRAYTEAVANRTPYVIDHRLLLADGRIKQVRERCETLYAEDGTPVLSRGTVQDITQLQAVEEALRASEERWKFALEGAGDGVWDWNMQTGEMFLSPQEMTVLGYEGEDGSKTHISEWVDRQHSDDRPIREVALQRYLSGEAPLYTCEFRTRARDGQWRWILARGVLVSHTPDGKPLRMIGTHANITERKRAEEALREGEEKLRGLYELSPLGICLTDMAGHIVEFNYSFRHICGYTDDELRKLDYWALTPRKYEPDEQRQLESLARTGTYGPYEKEFVRKDGSLVPVRLNGMLVTGRDGLRYIWSIVEDISQWKAMEQELIARATTDPLTGMANRRRFFEQTHAELDRVRRFDNPAALLVVDIDHFKRINDSYGHAAGDAVLQHFAELVRQRLRHTDLAGRLGGEEFGILLAGTDAAGAWSFADSLRRQMAAMPAQTGQGAVAYTASFGVAEILPSDVTPDSILSRADAALYRAKRGGRNRVEAG